MSPLCSKAPKLETKGQKELERSDEAEGDAPIPDAWRRRVKVNITRDIPAIQALTLAAPEGCKVSAFDVSDDRISFTGERRFFDLVFELAAELKWRVEITREGNFIIRPDAPYWHSYEVPLSICKHTTSTHTQDGVGLNKAEFNKDIWPEISTMLTSLRESGLVKTFTVLPQSSMICVEATQAGHRKINQFIGKILDNNNTQILLELAIVEVHQKPGSMEIPNSIIYGGDGDVGRQEEEEPPSKRRRVIERVEGPEAGEHRPPPPNPLTTIDWMLSYFGSMIGWNTSTLAKPPLSQVIKDVASGINVLCRYGNVRTVFRWSGTAKHNQALVANTGSTNTAYVAETSSSIMQQQAKHFIPISKSVTRQSQSIGMIVAVFPTITPDGSVSVSLQFQWNELGKLLPASTKEVVAGRLHELVSHNFGTTLMLRDGETGMVGGLKLERQRQGVFGLNRGRPYWMQSRNDESRLMILITTKIERQQSKVKLRTLEDYALKPLEQQS